MTSIIYTLLAVLGLSFLIFIHELGHYWMARRVGMRVETCSIGFGRPIFSWMRDGVKWQVCWLIFGGYVKIAGTSTEEGEDPYEVKDGFYGKSPLNRIKVAFMGPFVNLVFAFLVFAALWFMGGREKSFHEFSNIIGWVDAESELYVNGIRPGDQIVAYDAVPFQSFKDHIEAPTLSGEEVIVDLKKGDFPSDKEETLQLTVKPYKHPDSTQESIKTAGVLESARYLIYDKLPNGEENPLPEGSPLIGSGIEYGDRIIWVDGEPIFSLRQLNDVLNDSRVLLTVQRGDEIFIRRVPRVHVQEFRPNSAVREELIDWQFEAGLKDRKFDYLYTIPYDLTYNTVVEGQLKFIDEESEKEAFPEHPFSDRDLPLQAGDRIIAIQGTPVTQSYELFKELQEKKVNIVVERSLKEAEPLSWDEADAAFDQHVNWEDLSKIAASIGTESQVSHLGNLHLLNPVKPKKQIDIYTSPEKKAWAMAELNETKKMIEQIDDPAVRALQMEKFEKRMNDQVLGFAVQDRQVVYNPRPLELFSSTLGQMGRFLSSLVSRNLDPKNIAGPVGILQIVKGSGAAGIKETLFWIGFISLNLGVLNLLPVPILDGGTIVFSFIELVTGRRINQKVMEMILLVFGVLLFSFFIYITYNDVLRLFG